ncbi:hypothetical protein V6N11_071254 [Hibiscus sabdariffa]|uniref:Uncharacterized protein n=1 Tax=Hibiscus sabdariffa TaxID=183260 RepID=A0ABR2TZK7_9ROSI
MEGGDSFKRNNNRSRWNPLLLWTTLPSAIFGAGHREMLGNPTFSSALSFPQQLPLFLLHRILRFFRFLPLVPHYRLT